MIGKTDAVAFTARLNAELDKSLVRRANLAHYLSNHAVLAILRTDRLLAQCELIFACICRPSLRILRQPPIVLSLVSDQLSRLRPVEYWRRAVAPPRHSDWQRPSLA